MSDSSVSQAVDLLEARLKRIEYVVGGHKPEFITREGSRTASQRLKELERGLDHIVQRSKVSQDLMKLYARHPELFQQHAFASNETFQDVSIKLPVVLSAASSYPFTASSLTSITDMPIPATESSTSIISTGPEVAKLELLQASQMRQLSVLKQRSAAVLERYYNVDILETGEYWAEVENRIAHIEQGIRRAARLKELDEGTI